MNISFDIAIERISNEGIAGITSFIGCTDEEILKLESKYNVTLPNDYRRFLKLMGKDSGCLLGVKRNLARILLQPIAHRGGIND